MTDYKAIFDGVESTLINLGSKTAHPDKIRKNLDWFKHVEHAVFTDADYYSTLVWVTFYSGFRAATVNARMESIRSHFPDYETVAGYDDAKVERIAQDAGMIRNRRKIQACVNNAKTFRHIVQKHGSFRKYLESFGPAESFENLMVLKEELDYRFYGLGQITTYHFLTDIGFPVLKPDRVICRIFKRLGLIESDEHLLKAIVHGKRFSQATGHPIRYIDIVFVAYGQVRSDDFGITRGICLEHDPSCNLCGVRNYCSYAPRAPKDGF
ncbi:MAG: DNA-3-methyladenine glycosylase I [Pirellulaceae bacterium]|nr:DNA-3-methyladenine glycosylase I [Pirellulaceae bacterium]